MERREIYCPLLGGHSRRSGQRSERDARAGGYDAPRRPRASTSARPPHSKAIIAEATASLPEEKASRSNFRPATKPKSKSSKPKASKTRTPKAAKSKPSRAERKQSPGKKPNKKER